MTENCSFRQLLDKSNAIHLTVNRYFISIYLVFHRLREGRIRVDNQCLFAQNENECVKVIKWAGITDLGASFIAFSTALVTLYIEACN